MPCGAGDFKRIFGSGVHDFVHLSGHRCPISCSGGDGEPRLVSISLQPLQQLRFEPLVIPLEEIPEPFDPIGEVEKPDRV